jgi:hypothetical protein
MITVSNAKVAGFVPEWAPFRGFSILFDNPGDSVRPTERYELLACDVDSDPALGFYRALRDALASLDVRLLTHAYLFCPLPPASYHVTVWDGANDGNAQSVAPEHRESIRHLLGDLPAALREPPALLQAVRESALVARRDWNLSFRYSRLSLVGRGVLLTELEPATPGDAERLEELVRARAALSALTQATYGFSPYHRYWPHVSLGYFANREHAQLAQPCVAQWSAAFAERLSGHVLSFAHASIYGFSDMATFFRTST